MSDAPYRLLRTARAPVPAPVLDEAQRSVVEHPGGPLLVLAGPGTGKTTTLVESVVARVDRGVPVDQILMLTFSRRAAGEMRDRVAARLDRTMREPIARTLHSYAFGVLRMAAVRDNEPAPRLLAAAEQDVVIRELLADGDPARWPSSLRPALRTLGFAAELRDLLMRAVERGLDGPELRRIGAAHGRADWVAAGEFLTEYHGVTVLRDPGGYDPAELIHGALNVLRDDPELLAAERERRRRIFVDEYQDTDPAQAELLQLLASGADELILVGDPDQSIYAFRGADESAIRDVDERFGTNAPVPVVALTQSRRSGAVLLAATRRLAARLPGRAEQRALVPAGDLPPGRVDVEVFRSASEEAAYLAGVLRAAYLDGLPWSQMAVLVRSTALTLGTLRRAMITAGVPVAVRGDDIPLAEQPPVAMLLAVLSCSLDVDLLTEELVEMLLVGPIGGGDSVYLRRLRRLLRQQFPDDDGQLTPVVRDTIGAEMLPEGLRRPVVRVARVLAAGQRAVAEGDSTEAVLWAIWSATGLAGRWETASLSAGVSGAAADRDLDAVVELFDAAAKFTDRLPGAKPDQFAAHLRAQQIPGDGFTGSRPEPEAVSILTAHASKGLEWDLVCVAGVQEGTWPDLRRRGSLLGTEVLVDAVRGIDGVPLASFAPQLAEERRLFYVAATRARSRLVVTAVAGDEEQPSRLLDELDPSDGTRPLARPLRGVHLPGLVAELRAVVCAEDEPEPARHAAAAELARLAHAGVSGADPDEWWGLADLSTDAGTADPDRPVRVSPSRIESFLTCELRTLMQDLGVRDDSAVAASLGIVVHDLASNAPDDQPLDEFERQLQEVWDSIDFGASWFAVNERARATTMLTRLVGWLHDSRAELTRIGVERGFEVAVGDATIAGRVDRLEKDAEGRLVVVDLKTGKSKPKDSELPTHPQLGTYQLAIQHGAFPDEGTEPGGAVLVQLGRTEKAVEQWQPPLAQSDDPDWARRAVDHVAARMRGHEFTAMENSRCQICDVRSCCPLQVQGRQVPS
jgi:superfamily I DNA/RNA helicase/RecB family exonuclease